jgi:Protein of unknown function (DUF3563)
MYFKPPMYEGDGYIRDGLGTHLEPVLAADTITGQIPLSALAVLERDARRERSAYLLALLVRIGAWFKAIPARARETEAERYLAKSTDLADLERRIRRLNYGVRNGFAG